MRIPRRNPVNAKAPAGGNEQWLIFVRSTADLPAPIVFATIGIGARNAVREPAPDGDGSAAVRLCLAADVERYSRFNDLEAARAQERFTSVLDRARLHAGLTEPDVDVHKDGDGQFAVLPPGLDESAVVPDLVAGLSIALRQTNADLSEHARLRLRVAVYRGLLMRGVNGWVGHCATAVSRLLNSDPLRAALAQAPAADFALIAADTLYRDVLAHGHRGLAPERFHATTVDIPAKRFTERAWIYLGPPRSC